MDLQKVETRDADGDVRLVMVIDHEIEVTVEKFGTGEYTIQLRNISSLDRESDPAKTVEDRFAAGLRAVGLLEVDQETLKPAHGAKFWGQALVWAEPVTLAHVVRNFLSNQ